MTFSQIRECLNTFAAILIRLFEIKLSLALHKVEVEEKLVIEFFWYEES